MSASEIAADIAEAFDELKEEFLGASALLTLYKENGSDETFDKIVDLQGGWYSEFSDFFGNTVFSVADISGEFGAQVRKSDHLVVTGSDIPELNDMIFELLAESVGPSGDAPYWKLIAKSKGRRYKGGEEL